jgi:hypothetical protein
VADSGSYLHGATVRLLRQPLVAVERVGVLAGENGLGDLGNVLRRRQSARRQAGHGSMRHVPGHAGQRIRQGDDPGQSLRRLEQLHVCRRSRCRLDELCAPVWIVEVDTKKCCQVVP